MRQAPKSLIINSPYQQPKQHWQQARDGSLAIIDERRAAGYEIVDTRNNTRRLVELGLVNRIRERVDAWRADNYSGITSVTRRLLEHWWDPTVRQYPFYYCQLEAVETLIWMLEAPADATQGIYVPGDGGDWQRLCSKMATGSGKTAVMAMIITWQVLNALTYPKRAKDFAKAIFIVAPGLTVKERLRVLKPGEPDNEYDAFNLCPNDSLRHKLNQMALVVDNWHALMPLKQPTRSVQKKGPESDEAFTRRVLGAVAEHKDIIVINDEAHHAYRVPAEVKISKKEAAESGQDLDEATRWIEGLDRLHKTRRIARCFDLTATPFAPTGKKSTEKGLFEWILSDFGLNDAIEAGLVKTPRVVIRDDGLPDAKTYQSRLYHLYYDPDVHDDLNRKAQVHESLPPLLQKAYTLLGADWRVARREWDQAGHSSPPVMLTVCNRTETAARVERYFRQGDAHWPELHDPERTLRVDSRVLEKAEIGETAGGSTPGDREALKDYEAHLHQIVEHTDLPATRKSELRALPKEELLREIVDNVGKRGKAGHSLQNIISVAMLSEGWDAKNVTHIMGLRAFTSQLLCEQVIGRGLRRVSYETDDDGLFKPEYVNVFGVPLSIFQDATGEGEAPDPPKNSEQIESLPERGEFEITWPNVLRVETVITPALTLDWERVGTLAIDPAMTPISAEIAPAVGGAADMSQVHAIDLERIPEGFRLQRLLFRAAHKALEEIAGQEFTGNREYLVVQLIRIIEQFFDSDKLEIPSLFHQEPLRKRILFALNIDAIVAHVVRFVHEQNRERITPVFDEDMPIGSTGFMRTWYTTKPCQPTLKSQISHVVHDSTWEKYTADLLETHEQVVAYAKNDHLNFHVLYMYNGVRRRYLPDFLIRLANGGTLVLEIKGQDSEQNRTKRAAMGAWVTAINDFGGFGQWRADVAFEPSRIQDILAEHLADG